MRRHEETDRACRRDLLGRGLRIRATSSIFVGTRTCRPSGAAQPSLPATIGFVKVTAFIGSDDVATAFADHIHHTIIAADRDDLVGWVVDLRGNGGGNMWPRDQPRVAVLSDHSIASSGEATLIAFRQRPNT